MTARDQYAAGRIDHDRLEKLIERELLIEERAHGRAHIVPDAWEPLPPCQHDWVDITTLGQRELHHLCATCGETRLPSDDRR